VLRYNGTTGAFIDTFISAGSGGLKVTQGIEFGPDGDFYVCSLEGNEILRYNGLTGAFIEVVGSQSNSGLVRPQGLEFDANGMLYVSEDDVPDAHADDSILRYGRRSVAVFTVSLSAAAGVPITVNYSTAQGTALAGSDFVALLGTLNFAPGETTKAILVSTADDTLYEGNEIFFVDLSNVSGGAVIADGRGAGTIEDDELPPTKFYVVNDATQNRTYEYGPTGSAIENYALNSDNIAPRGAASTVAGDKTWVVDSNRKVYIYNTGGALLGSWTAGSLAANATVEGIATNGTDVWIVDAKSDKVYRYAGAASRLSGSQNATSSFALNSSNTSPKDIVTDGAHLWVVNDSSTDKVFKYTLSGSLIGSWTISSGGGSPTGITIDPANVSDVWIVDSSSDRVYQFTAAATRTSGSQSPATSFALASGNTNPQGIADPPPVSSQGGSQAALDESFASLDRRAGRDSSSVAARALRIDGHADLRIALDFVFSSGDEFGSRRMRKGVRSLV
jgi:hypothetical protein